MRRKQLEEDMRRMILKNMTAMNFEALQVRRHCACYAMFPRSPQRVLSHSPFPCEWL